MNITPLNKKTEFEWIRKYRNAWVGLSTFADITSEQGKDTIITVIERFDATTSAVFSRAMPIVAVVAEVIALFAALSAMLPWYITTLASTVLIMIPVVATRYMFLAPDEEQKTFRILLIVYYVLAFSLVFLLKIFTTSFVSSSLAWLILPSLSVLAVVLYGKTLSIELPEEKAINETIEALRRAMIIVDELKADKEKAHNIISGLHSELEGLQQEIECLKAKPLTTVVKPVNQTNGNTLKRRMKLLDILVERYESDTIESVNKSAIAKELNTSHTTIGNDMRWLEKQEYIDTSGNIIEIRKSPTG